MNIPTAFQVSRALTVGTRPLSRRLLRSSGSPLGCLPEFLKCCGYALVTLLFFILSTALSAEKNPVPRFVSLKSNEINQRVGPGPNYPIGWVYLKADLPVEIIAEFDNWRKIQDKDGTEGWVHQSMVCSKRRGIIQGEKTVVYSAQDVNSQPLVRLEPGVLVEILKCRDDWCQVRVLAIKGWIQRSFLWGVYPQEVIG